MSQSKFYILASLVLPSKPEEPIPITIARTVADSQIIIDVMRFYRLVFAAALAGLVWGGAHMSSATSVRQIMETMVDPPAILIWRSVSTTVTPEGVKETFPRNDQEWNDLRKAAALLAEGGKLLKKERWEGDRGNWLKWSQSIVDAADATLKAVDAKSPDQILAAGEKIYDTCVACHGGYSMMTPP